MERAQEHPLSAAEEERLALAVEPEEAQVQALLYFLGLFSFLKKGWKVKGSNGASGARGGASAGAPLSPAGFFFCFKRGGEVKARLEPEEARRCFCLFFRFFSFLEGRRPICRRAAAFVFSTFLFFESGGK